jgi:N-acetylglutamate synthase
MPFSPAHRDDAADSFQFRDFAFNDYEAVRALWDAIMPSSLSAADSADGVRRFLERNPGTSVVALHRDIIVGAALAGHDGRRGLIHHLAVAEAHRHQGVASRLVTECLERLARAGIDKCHVLVFENNAGGNAFWRAIGAVERDELALYSLTTAR